MQFQLELEAGPLEKSPSSLWSVPAAGMWRPLGPQLLPFIEQIPEPDPLPRTPGVFLQLQQKLTSRVPSTDPDLPRCVILCGTLG